METRAAAATRIVSDYTYTLARLNVAYECWGGAVNKEATAANRGKRMNTHCVHTRASVEVRKGWGWAGHAPRNRVHDLNVSSYS